MLDPATMRAGTSVWRVGDANCCPAGGRVEIYFGLRDEALFIERLTHRPE